MFEKTTSENISNASAPYSNQTSNHGCSREPSCGKRRDKPESLLFCFGGKQKRMIIFSEDEELRAVRRSFLAYDEDYQMNNYMKKSQDTRLKEAMRLDVIFGRLLSAPLLQITQSFWGIPKNCPHRIRQCYNWRACDADDDSHWRHKTTEQVEPLRLSLKVNRKVMATRKSLKLGNRWR